MYRLISEQAVIDMMKSKWSAFKITPEVIKCIKAIPSAEPTDLCKECKHFKCTMSGCGEGYYFEKSAEPKTGHWIMSEDGLYRPICDKCGAHPWKGYIPTVEEATETFKYCPNCGCRMEEGDTE